MISALRGYSESQPTPPDATSVTITANYLEACNLIFERGILSRQRVKGMNSPVIENMKDGFQFFVDWFQKHKEKGKCKFWSIKVYLLNRVQSVASYYMCHIIQNTREVTI